MGDLARLAPVSAQKTSSRILVIDIERIPGHARTKHRGLTIEGDFWDLNGWKHTIGRRLHADDVPAYPRTICFGWRWYGHKRVNFEAEWLEGGHEGMLRKAWELYDEADVVVGHNVKGFDSKRLQGDWWSILGLAPPRPVKFVDTLTICRQQFGFESNTLDAVLTRIGLQGKTDRYSADMAKRAAAGDVKARRQLKRYNVGDIDASTLLYDALRGWIPGHPHLGRHGDKPSCNQCGGEDLTLYASTYTAQVLEFPLYRCDHCGGLVAGRWHSGRVASTKGVKSA